MYRFLLKKDWQELLDNFYSRVIVHIHISLGGVNSQLSSRRHHGNIMRSKATNIIIINRNEKYIHEINKNNIDAYE